MKEGKEKRGTMTGATEKEKDGQRGGKGETSVLKPACTLP